MPKLPAWAWTTISVSVAATWIALNIIDAVSTSYEVGQGVHSVMGTVTGATGASAYLEKRKRSSDG